MRVFNALVKSAAIKSVPDVQSTSVAINLTESAIKEEGRD